jgi:MFS family permease
MQNSSAPVKPAPPATDAPHVERWRAGTLTYTTGGLIGLFAFLLLGDFAWSLKERAVPAMFTALLKEYSTNSKLVAALTGVLPAVITITLAPVIGMWSDRYRSRLGRRIPFLIATAPIIGLSMVCLAYSESLGTALNHLLGGAEHQRTTIIIVVMALAWTIFEVATIIANGLFIALINDTVPRQIIGRFYGIFRIFSLAVASAFFGSLFNNSMMTHFQTILLVFAAVYVVGFLILCWGVREGQYPPPPVKSPQPFAGQVAAFVRSSLSVRFYALLFVVFSIATTSFAPININSFFAKDQFGVDTTSFGYAMSTTYIISMCLAFPLGWLADRFHPLYTTFVCMISYALIMLVSYAVVSEPTTFTVCFIAHGVLAGAFFTSSGSLLLVLLPQNRFQEYYSAFGVIGACMGAVVSMSVGGLLDFFGRDFRLIFLGGGLIATVASLGWLLVIREFNRLGGKNHYVSPGSEGLVSPSERLPMGH